jgi:hypothetical protein
MPKTVTIPARFNGPLDSGQGGYVSGVVGNLIGGPAEVSLRRAVPVDRPLDVARDGDGTVQLLDGDELVAEGRPAPDFELDVPETVDVETARGARSRYRGLPDGVFSRCFVCGRARDDAFGVFAGAVDGREVVASSWHPPAWTADNSGHVRPEFVWAVLDCPTYFATYLDADLGPAVLARETARIHGPVVAGEDHTVIAWPLEVDGRKRQAGAAVLAADRTALATARVLMIEPRAR